MSLEYTTGPVTRAEKAEAQLDHMKKAIGEEAARLRKDARTHRELAKEKLQRDPITPSVQWRETLASNLDIAADRLDSILKGVEG